jgi:superfamily I DNA and/or RNA helicase
LRWQNNYIKGLFENANSIKEADNIFNEKLGKNFQQLKRIQKDWFAFLSNADTDEGDKKKSMLNDGSVEIDLRTAFVKSVNVIGATCIHIASSQYSKINFRFDYVIMDESSKATPAENLVPINMGQNIILIGDHKQLPPVITREDAVKQKVRDKLDDNGLDIEKEFGESLFEKLILEFEANPNLQRNIKMLDIQYRMPRQIGNLISRFFYDEKLKNPDTKLLAEFDTEKSHGLTFREPNVSIFDTAENRHIEVPNSVIFISTSNQENPNDNNNKFNRKNTANQRAIKEILEQLDHHYPDNLSRKEPFTIGIIAGYRGQVNSLQDGIDLLQYKNFVMSNEDGKREPLIEINTVDKFQGAERDIIIYDIVKSSKGSSSIGFLDDYRRINVAFSRVKRLLIVVGDSEYILKRATLNPSGKFKEFKLKEIVTELDRQGVIVHRCNEIIL